MRHPALLFPVDPLRHCAQEVLHERGHAAVARGVDALAELAHGLVLDLALPHRRREQGGRVTLRWTRWYLRSSSSAAAAAVVAAAVAVWWWWLHNVLVIVFVAGWLLEYVHVRVLEYIHAYCNIAILQYTVGVHVHACTRQRVHVSSTHASKASWGGQ